MDDLVGRIGKAVSDLGTLEAHHLSKIKLRVLRHTFPNELFMLGIDHRHHIAWFERTLHINDAYCQEA